jgi:hypothetical protein
MTNSRRSIYVFGAGHSHDRSSGLPKNGLISVAIEKERIIGRRHNGGDGVAAIEYRLKAEGAPFTTGPGNYAPSGKKSRNALDSSLINGKAGKRRDDRSED